jgi:hypothetical protein
VAEQNHAAGKLVSDRAHLIEERYLAALSVVNQSRGQMSPSPIEKRIDVLNKNWSDWLMPNSGHVALGA